jgi:hypothetical protein
LERASCMVLMRRHKADTASLSGCKNISRYYAEKVCWDFQKVLPSSR